MIRTSETAAERVRAYVETRSKMGGLDPDLVNAANDVELTITDLRTLIIQAEALTHMAPHAAQAIENGPS